MGVGGNLSTIVALCLVVLLLTIGIPYGQSLPESSLDPSRLYAGIDPVALALVDLDGKLGLDLVVLNSRSGPQVVQQDPAKSEIASVSVFFGAGDGRFWEMAEVPLTKEKEQRTVESRNITTAQVTLQGIQPAALGVVDCDADGSPNVLTLHKQSKVITDREAVENPFMFSFSWNRSEGKADIQLVNEALYDKTPQTASQDFKVMQFAEGDSSIAVGDFDSNGKEDFAIVNPNQFALSLFQNTGGCVFTNGLEFNDIGSQGDEPRFVATGYLNKDRHLDLVAIRGGILSQNSPASGEVFLGHGDGTFKKLEPFQTTTQARSLVIEDFNNDGKADLIVAGLSNLVFLAGRGDGAFKDKQQLAGFNPPLPEQALVGLVTTDFNGDRKMDLAMANPGNASVAVYLGNGDGTFNVQEIKVGEGAQPVALTAGDLDADGDKDLVAVTQARDRVGEVIVLRNSGQGAFERLAHPRVGPGASSIAVGDFNGDRRMDLAGTYPRLGEVVLYARDQDGNPPWKRVPPISIEGSCAETGAFVRGSFPVSVAAADFNGDTRQDLAVVNSSPGNVAILLSQMTPDASLAFRCDVYQVGYYPVAIIKADLNAGKEIDLVVVNNDSSNVSVLLGNVDGTFQDRRQYQVGDHPVAVAAADLDGVNGLDLVVANAGSGDLSILMNQGDGTFEKETRLSLIVKVGGTPSAVTPSAVAVADFIKINGDNNLDIAVVVTDASGVTQIYIVPGVGKGSFGAAQQIPEGQTLQVGTGPQALLARDLNGDSYDDLIVAGGIGSNAVYLLTNSGSGDFRFTVTSITKGKDLLLGQGDLINPTALALADLNGDGKQDPIIATEFPPPRGAGISIVADVIVEPPLPGACKSPNSLAVGDFDGDHIQDLAVTCQGSNSVATIWSKGSRNFEGPLLLPLDGSQGPTAIVTGDLNEDRRQDLVVVDTGSNRILVLLGQGDHNFDHKARDVGVAPIAIAKADFDLDGHEDLAVANEGSGTVSVLLGDGKGSFPTDQEKTVRARDSPKAIAVEDFDGDSYPDLAVVDMLSDAVLVFLNKGERDPGKFQDPNVFSAGVRPTAVVAEDLNNDGHLDLVVVNSGPAYTGISVLFNDGQGHFPQESIFNTKAGEAPTAIAAGDCSGDKLPDLAVVDRIGDALLLFLNRGNRTFSLMRTISIGLEPTAIAAGDIDGNGTLDLVVTNSGSNSVSILFGDGSCNFARKDIKLSGGE